MSAVITTELNNAQLAYLASLGMVTAVTEPATIPQQKSAFFEAMERLIGTNLPRSKGVRPAATINTNFGKRGVFWVGVKNGELRVGTCKMTDIGRLHKPNRYDGSWFQSVESLEQYN